MIIDPCCVCAKPIGRRQRHAKTRDHRLICAACMDASVIPIETVYNPEKEDADARHLSAHRSMAG